MLMIKLEKKKEKTSFHVHNGELYPNLSSMNYFSPIVNTKKSTQRKELLEAIALISFIAL
jgi:hypothetical protein